MFVHLIQDRGADGWGPMSGMWFAEDEEALVASVDWFYLAREHYAPIGDEV